MYQIILGQIRKLLTNGKSIEIYNHSGHQIKLFGIGGIWWEMRVLMSMYCHLWLLIAEISVCDIIKISCEREDTDMRSPEGDFNKIVSL